nr:NADH dehydrogenase subunit 4 [Meteorus sp. 1 XHS-2023a]
MMMMLIPLISIYMIMYNMKPYKLIFQNFIFFFMLIYMNNFNMNNYYLFKMYYNFGIDSITFNMILLSFWIINLSFMSNYKMIFKKFNNMFFMIMLTLLILLIMCFSTTNLFMFYILFESSLIPLMILILGWGLQIDRIQASMYMLFYTLFGSLPLLMMIIIILNKLNSNSFNFLNLNLILMNNIFYFMMLFTAFLTKTPMYFIHLWLPKAHVEAPVSGSMILAGIILKLGTYGIYRILPIFNLLSKKLNYPMISILIMGSLYSALICFNQNDLKIIVAYSSIVHMNMMVASMFTLSNWGYLGSLCMMMAHGLCSSAMFCLVNFMYERTHTRNILINKGMINLSPSMTILWFMVCSSNFSAPPSLNLFSEIMLINGLLSFLKINLIFIFLITFYSTFYSIYLFSLTQHSYIFKTNKFNLNNSWEYLIILLHWMPLNLMFMIMIMF